jgi:hypothetical protein
MVAVGDDVLASQYNAWAQSAIVRLIQQAAQSIPTGVLTAIQYAAGSEDQDTLNFHDPTTNNTRITPNIAGYYGFRACYFTSGMTTPSNRSTYFRKNGSITIAPGPRDGGLTITSSVETFAGGIFFNGSTDYMEHMAQQASSGAVNTSVTAQQASVFECYFIHP